MFCDSIQFEEYSREPAKLFENDREWIVYASFVKRELNFYTIYFNEIKII